MADVVEILQNSWARVRPRLLADPDELQRRLARRRRSTLQRPPRAWCIAVRASDTRINPATAILCPEDAVNPRDLDHPGRCTPHEVTLDTRLLRQLCRPVCIQPPGEIWDELARRLGTHPVGLRTGRIKGLCRAHYVRGLAGRRGRPIPILYTDELLDPGSKGFVPADPFWSWTADDLPDYLPDDFQQAVQRVPLYRSLLSRRHFDEHVHPEAAEPSPPAPLRRIPPAPPDYVWYKWKDGVYVGDAYDRHLERQREARRRHPRKPRPRVMREMLSFRGWQWLCPVCAQTANTLYCPLPPIHLVGDDALRLAASIAPHPQSGLRKPNAAFGGFACRRCQNVLFFSRNNPDSWNELVSILSGGLLYGSEVPKPAEFVPTRRRKPYRPMLNRPSPRRQHVLELLLKGMPIAQIARELGIRPASVHNHRHKIYRQHGVHSRAGLADKLRVKLDNPSARRQGEIQDLLLKRLPSSAIATTLRLTVHQVNYSIRCIFKAHRVHGRAELITKLCPPRRRLEEERVGARV